MIIKFSAVLILCAAFFAAADAQTKTSQKTSKKDSPASKTAKKEASKNKEKETSKNAKDKKSQDKDAKDKDEKKSKEKLKTVVEGGGIEGITVGKSTMNDVVKKFGKDYKWGVNKNYSYQMNYPNGLAFYMCQSDKRKEIFLIEIKPPYKAKTKRGIILGKSTKEETEKIYGKPKDGFEYRGVSFYYNTYKNRRIISEIDVTENAGIRQCKVND